MRVWLNKKFDEPADVSKRNVVWVEMPDRRMLTLFDDGTYALYTGHIVQMILEDDPDRWERIS